MHARHAALMIYTAIDIQLYIQPMICSMHALYNIFFLVRNNIYNDNNENIAITLKYVERNALI